MQPSLENKTVLITGASAGIGESCAQLFAEAGANLILTARRGERLKKMSDVFTTTRPAHVQIADMIIFPTKQAAATVVHRDII